jgi:hypothetical protein
MTADEKITKILCILSGLEEGDMTDAEIKILKLVTGEDEDMREAPAINQANSCRAIGLPVRDMPQWFFTRPHGG